MMESATTAAFASWAADFVKGRDASHGPEHFERVRRKAVALAEETPPPPDSHSRRVLVELTALAHDIIDHKYVSAEDVPVCRSLLEKALLQHGGDDITPEEVRAVMLAAENVSLSKELRGELQLDELLAARAGWLRDLVSDADKLDALGATGLRRIFEYNAKAFEALEDPAAILELATSHSRQFLEHRVHYLRGETARIEAVGLLSEMQELLKDGVAMAEMMKEVFELHA